MKLSVINIQLKILLLFLFTFLSCKSSDKEKLSKAQKLTLEKKYQDAIGEYTKLINGRKLIQPALYYRGITYLESRHYKEALNDFDRLINLNTSNGVVFIVNEKSPFFKPKDDEISVLKAHFRRGQAYYYLDSLEKAFWDFQLCIDEGFDGESTCHLWQGHIRLKQRDNRKACLAFHSAIETSIDRTTLNQAESLIKNFCQ